MELSLFYFAASSQAPSSNAYALLLEGAKFADRNGFAAVWTPERHFHPFGGLYPNPSVTSAAVAAVTREVAIRAGSVVLPLHDPLRVAEEWSIVDNLSGGRAGVAFASGWHAVDFALAPDAYGDRRTAFVGRLDQVRRLWRGEQIDRVDGAGKEVRIGVYPRPVQPELPVWVTSSGSLSTVRLAGEVGANLLTHLLGQDPDELAVKIAEYRAVRGEGGHVTLMLHTFAGPDDDTVREQVRGPMCDYLKHSFDLVARLSATTGDEEFDVSELDESDVDFLVNRAFERYFVTSGLFGSMDTCLDMLDKLASLGVDEVACLIDFGVDTASTLDSLDQLALVRAELAK
jgi:natural product biosynthesis luciferase-like monooxygenase protein